MSTSDKLAILTEVLGEGRRSSDEVLFYCPRCATAKRKLSVNIGLNKFQCWKCGWSGHDNKKIVKRFGSRDLVDRWNTLTGQVDFAEIDLFGQEEKHSEETILELPKEFTFLGNKKLPISSIDARLYLRERGIDKGDICKWKIGYASTGRFAERIIFPSFNLKGSCNFFVARSYKNGMKYMNPEANKGIIFNELYVDFEQTITLTEGVFDAVIAGNSIPLLGSTLTEDSRLLYKLSETKLPVYVALDPDAKTKEERIINLMLEHGIETRKVPVSPYKDVGSMTKIEFQKRKEQAIPMNPDSLLEKMLMEI